MEGKCLTKCIVYKASVSSLNEAKHYLGTAEDEFKTHYNNHKMLFKNHKEKILSSPIISEC